ncbi:hypothetical protein [Halomonas maura]|uniref:hypothetical protein n=1 Tax=Halomonas maura TaxID=117606 RepID=UPI0025B4A00F|nr:hypothetical protein [Halomonas maura]MDN3557806.1 hypothetical protein [Halomonas maura]
MSLNISGGLKAALFCTLFFMLLDYKNGEQVLSLENFVIFLIVCSTYVALGFLGKWFNK